MLKRILACGVSVLLLLAMPHQKAWAPLVKGKALPPVDFFLQEAEDGTPYLHAIFTDNLPLNNHVRLGHIYLSCYRGSINDFRLHALLETYLNPLLEGSDRLYLGVSSSNENNRIVISAPDNGTVENPPPAFKFEQYVRGFSDIVRGYSPFGTDDRESIYISTFPDAKFFQAFSKSDLLSLIYHSGEELRFNTAFQIQYALTEAARVSFLKACVDPA